MTQLNRSIERWKGCDPAYMATEQSPAAITYAFIDAQHDILALADVLRALVENEWLEAFKYLDGGIGIKTDAGKRWINARAVLGIAK